LIPDPATLGTGDHFVAAGLVLLSIALMFQKLPDIPDIRRHFYVAGAATGTFLAAWVLLMWALGGRPLARFGLRSWGGEPAVTVATALGWGAFLLIVLALLKRGWLRERLGKIHGRYEQLMPRTRSELWASWGTSLAAGTGEEIAYRGFLLWYASAFAGVPLAVAAVTLLFGISHGYQSRFGMIFATLAGLLLAGIYLASGSLLLAIWIHATYNMSSFAAGRITLSSDRTA